MPAALRSNATASARRRRTRREPRRAKHRPAKPGSGATNMRKTAPFVFNPARQQALRVPVVEAGASQNRTPSPGSGATNRRKLLPCPGLAESRMPAPLLPLGPRTESLWRREGPGMRVPYPSCSFSSWEKGGMRVPYPAYRPRSSQKPSSRNPESPNAWIAPSPHLFFASALRFSSALRPSPALPLSPSSSLRNPPSSFRLHPSSFFPQPPNTRMPRKAIKFFRAFSPFRG